MSQRRIETLLRQLLTKPPATVQVLPNFPVGQIYNKSLTGIASSEILDLDANQRIVLLTATMYHITGKTSHFYITQGSQATVLYGQTIDTAAASGYYPVRLGGHTIIATNKFGFVHAGDANSFAYYTYIRYTV